MRGKRVFLDSSVVIAALLSGRGGSFYIMSVLRGEFRFQINEQVLREVVGVLDRKFSSEGNLKKKLFLLIGIASIEILPIPSRDQVKRLEKLLERGDAAIFASALQCSDYFLTLDDDFLNESVIDFAKKKGLAIVKPGDFISLHRESLL